VTSPVPAARIPEFQPPGMVPATAGRRIGFLITLLVLPVLILAAAVPALWRWGLGWHDVVITALMYLLSIFGITIGYHRYFTHRAFKCGRPLRIVLAVAGGVALEGPVTLWVAEHRRHHKFADRPGDPHSPWRFGDSGFALLKGLLWAQVGWFFAARHRSAREHWAPDLLADPAIRRLDALYPLIAAGSLLLPAALGGLWALSWQGALTGLFWGGFVRYAIVHHVTWSVNSIAHTFGEQHFVTRDQSRDVRWVALLTLGEGWHNWHHADPTSARHGVLRGQLDPSARLIRVLERLGWVHDVRWPDPRRVAARRTG
jgi:stearoyl-CoA desaturase (delta-9 desaturase)